MLIEGSIIGKPTKIDELKGEPDKYPQKHINNLVSTNGDEPNRLTTLALKKVLENKNINPNYTIHEKLDTGVLLYPMTTTTGKRIRDRCDSCNMENKKFRMNSKSNVASFDQ